MSAAQKALTAAGCVAVALLIILLGWLGFTAGGRAAWNNWRHGIQKADDATSYETLQKVEDTCRAMISSYEADKATVDLYDGHVDDEKQGWADQAKMRANKTASTYNNYILENTYVWAGNVPRDIRAELSLLE